MVEDPEDKQPNTEKPVHIQLNNFRKNMLKTYKKRIQKKKNKKSIKKQMKKKKKSTVDKNCIKIVEDADATDKYVEESKTDDITEERMPTRVLVYTVNIKHNKSIILITFITRISDIQYIKRNARWISDIQRHELIKIIHLSATEIIETTEYKEWLNTLPGEQMVCLSTYGEGDGYDIGFVQMLDRSVRLNKVNSLMFPLPFTLDRDNLPFLKKVSSMY